MSHRCLAAKFWFSLLFIYPFSPVVYLSKNITPTFLKAARRDPARVSDGADVRGQQCCWVEKRPGRARGGNTGGNTSRFTLTNRIDFP